MDYFERDSSGSKINFISDKFSNGGGMLDSRRVVTMNWLWQRTSNVIIVKINKLPSRMSSQVQPTNSQ